MIHQISKRDIKRKSNRQRRYHNMFFASITNFSARLVFQISAGHVDKLIKKTNPTNCSDKKIKDISVTEIFIHCEKLKINGKSDFCFTNKLLRMA